MTRTPLAVSLLLLSCGASAPSAPSAQERAPTQTMAPSVGASASPRPATAPATAIATESPTALRQDERVRIELLLSAQVYFLSIGAGGRIAALADEGGRVAAHRFERGTWQSLALPAAERTSPSESVFGIYFGRDNRLRLMGHRASGAGRRMVYLRHHDGVWQDQRGEVGALASDSSQLYGVLGEADPEVVCKLGGICLVKSRKGWKELANTIPPTAVVRVFGGKGWALTAEGVFRADDGGFTRVGPPASWKGEVTGFWIGDDGAMAVAEPAANAIHRLDAGAATWKSEPAPIDGPRDVSGPPDDRWVCGDGGLVHGNGRAYFRVGAPTMHLSRWIAVGDGGFSGGPSGVFAVRALAP